MFCESIYNFKEKLFLNEITPFPPTQKKRGFMAVTVAPIASQLASNSRPIPELNQKLVLPSSVQVQA